MPGGYWQNCHLPCGDSGATVATTAASPCRPPRPPRVLAPPWWLRRRAPRAAPPSPPALSSFSRAETLAEPAAAEHAAAPCRCSGRPRARAGAARRSAPSPPPSPSKESSRGCSNRRLLPRFRPRRPSPGRRARAQSALLRAVPDELVRVNASAASTSTSPYEESLREARTRRGRPVLRPRRPPLRRPRFRRLRPSPSRTSGGVHRG